MPAEWTSSGPELPLRLDRSSPEPLRDQLESAIREAIRTGRLESGGRMPSSRQLAADLGVSRGLVTECYGQLQAEGYLVPRPGSATRVAAIARPPREQPARTVDRPAVRIDFRPGVPDLTGFPLQSWSQALRRACRDAPARTLGYPDPAGEPELRETLAGYLRRVRAAAADPKQMIICAGYAQGLALMLRALVDCGVRVVAVEEPGDPDHHTLIASLGLTCVAVPVDEHGIDVEALTASDARAVIVAPAHQSPTGVVLSADRRQAILQWAAAVDAVIIEDDYDAEFRYDRDPVGALQGLAPDRVALIGSVSKPLSPALRLGWTLCPSRLTADVVQQKRLADRGSPVLDQLALAELIRTGQYDRQLRRMRRRYAERRLALVEALQHHAPTVRLSGLAAGFHAVAQLPPEIDESAVVTAAHRRSVGLYGIGSYASTRAPRPPQLVLGFGNLRPDAIHEGIATVADLLV